MYKLGRQPRSFSTKIPRIEGLRAEMQAPLPQALSWGHGLPFNLGVMLNNTLGDCTCAGLAHARQVITYNATGKMVTLPNEYVLKLYQQGCGYVLNDPSTDQGGNEQALLTYCHQNGIPTPDGPDKILGFVEIDHAKIEDVKRTIAEAGFVYLGINIPNSWCSAPIGSIWDVPIGDIEGGHCIIGVGYDSNFIYVISWGYFWPMTWTAFAQVCDEAYLVADKAWIAATGKTPFGMSLEQLESSMAALHE
jgi:hypothetical protein